MAPHSPYFLSASTHLLAFDCLPFQCVFGRFAGRRCVRRKPWHRLQAACARCPRERVAQDVAAGAAAALSLHSRTRTHAHVPARWPAFFFTSPFLLRCFFTGVLCPAHELSRPAAAFRSLIRCARDPVRPFLSRQLAPGVGGDVRRFRRRIGHCPSRPGSHLVCLLVFSRLIQRVRLQKIRGSAFVCVSAVVLLKVRLAARVQCLLLPCPRPLFLLHQSSLQFCGVVFPLRKKEVVCP